MNTLKTSKPAAGYEIRFKSMFQEGRGLAFPCNSQGEVDLDDLSEKARTNYFYARAVVGREFLVPAIAACGLH